MSHQNEITFLYIWIICFICNRYIIIDIIIS